MCLNASAEKKKFALDLTLSDSADRCKLTGSNSQNKNVPGRNYDTVIPYVNYLLKAFYR